MGRMRAATSLAACFSCAALGKLVRTTSRRIGAPQGAHSHGQGPREISADTAFQEGAGLEARARRSACQSALQIVLRIAMTARKIWASQADDSFHLDRGYVHGEQFSGDPEIDNAPIGTRKALVNVPTLKPALIDAGGSLGTNRSRWIADTGETVGRISCRSCRRLCYHLRGQMQQVLSGAGEDCTSFNNLYPRSLTRGRASLELLVGKARQSAQVTGAGASQVAAVSVSQVLTDSRGHDMGSGVIQIEENIAGIYVRCHHSRIDLWGIGLLALGLGTLQIVLDTGQKLRLVRFPLHPLLRHALALRPGRDGDTRSQDQQPDRGSLRPARSLHRWG